MNRQQQYAIVAITLALLAVASPWALVTALLSLCAAVALVEVTGLEIRRRR